MVQTIYFKGNCVVVMDKQQYQDKALSLLNDKSTYAVLNSDPTSKTQRKLNKMLLDLKKAGKISDSTYKILYSSDGFCPRFYGLPSKFKIQKSGIPLRPIVGNPSIATLVTRVVFFSYLYSSRYALRIASILAYIFFQNHNPKDHPWFCVARLHG